jgi:Tol biopolymer transport system component
MKPTRLLLVVALLSTALIAVYPAYQAKSDRAEVTLQAAIKKEMVDGDLKTAIEQYKKIIATRGTSRETVAKAMLRLGGCYEKLGSKEAQQIYRRLINDYSENKNEVSVARIRLISLERTLADLNLKPTFRKINIASNPQNGVLSADGKKLAFISNGAVWIVPLHGNIDPGIAGEPIRLREIPGVADNGSLMAWSADGKWIAVNGQANGKSAAYVIPVNGGEPRVVQMPDRGWHAWGLRLSLSRDGQMLAFSALELNTRQEETEILNRYIYTIPTAGGKPKKISSGWARLPSFSSDGKFISYVGYGEIDDRKSKEESSRPGDLWVVASTGEKPLKLTSIDGHLRGPVWSPDGRYIAVHHEPRGNNDNSKEIWVYPVSPDVSGVGEPGKIVLPRSSMNMLAGWTPNNELGVFIQSEEHAAVYTVPASGGLAVQISPGGLAPYYPRWSKNGEDRIYFRGYNDMKVPLLYVPDAGGDPVTVPVKSERELISMLPGGGVNVSPDGKMIVTSAGQLPPDPKEGVDIWTIPLDGGSATRLTNDGLFKRYPCWSPDGRSIAFIKWHEKSKDEGFNAIYVIPAKGGEIRQITSEMDNVARGAIAYSPDGKQIAFFSGDAIKAISLESGKTEVLVAGIKHGIHSDLFYSPDGSKIAHNADDKIWITSLDGGKPQELKTSLPNNAKHYGFSWSPDGKKIAFTTSVGGEAEFWLISNFLPLEKLAQKNEKENVTESEGIRIKSIWKAPYTDWLGSVSPDGRLHAYVYWGDGDLAIRDLVSGENKILTHDADPDSNGFAEAPTFSRNGKQIAYSWWNPNHTNDLFLIDVNNPSPRRLYRREGEEAYPQFWLSDEELIFSSRNYTTRKVEVCSLNILNGTIHELRKFDNGQWGRLSGSPDGKYIAYDFRNKTDNGNFDISLLPDKGESEVPLIKHPANDRVLGWMPGRKEFLFISDRSGTWDLWAIAVDNGKPSGPVKRIYTDIGEVSPAGFAQNGDCFVGSARRFTNTLIAPFNPDTGEIDEKSGQALLGSPWTAGWSPDGRYLTYDNNIRDLKTGEERKFAENLQFTHPIRWSPDGNSVLVIGYDKVKRRREGSRGGVYSVDIKTGQINEVILLSDYKYTTPRDDAFPLSDVQWSSDGKSIFYLFFQDRLAKHDLATGEDKILYTHSHFDRGVMSLSPDGKNLLLATKSPEEKKSRLFTIPAEGGKEKMLCTAQEADNFYFAGWFPDGKYVYFVETKDGASLWRVPAEGGIPQKNWQLKNPARILGLHPDGKHIALSFSESTTEVKVIKNLAQELGKVFSMHK